MKYRSILNAAFVLLSVSVLAMPIRAAHSATTVNVALLDMSSVAGHGMMGLGMGMMGPGQGMMGAGQGMMGSGMMSIRTDKSTVKTGEIHFVATNWSRGLVHEMLVVAVEDPNAPLLYDYGTAKIPEEKVKALGEVAELEPNGAGTLDVKLAPGSYLLICNVAGHFAAGMVTPFTVTP